MHARDTGDFAHFLDLLKEELDSFFGLVPFGNTSDAFNDRHPEW